MSLFYGVAAGLFVSGATWAATTYISQLVGICLGFFLLTFLVISAVYLTGDDLMDRQKTLLKTLTRMEGLVLERLKDIDYKVSRVATSRAVGTSTTDTAAPLQRLEALLTLLDNIRQPTDVSPPTLPDNTAASRPLLHPEEVSVSTANARP
jgi:hypothetical protein